MKAGHRSNRLLLMFFLLAHSSVAAGEASAADPDRAALSSPLVLEEVLASV